MIVHKMLLITVGLMSSGKFGPLHVTSKTELLFRLIKRMRSQVPIKTVSEISYCQIYCHVNFTLKGNKNFSLTIQFSIPTVH